MVTVDSDFHSLVVTQGARTRIRIYFIGDFIDCTDDNAVQTNGTLLVGASGDTDSNGRIGQDGITITEIFNKDTNLSIGGAASYHISMTLLNKDGALNDFGFGRCKIYLDVWDGTNEEWLPCPLGVFNIDIPVKRKVQLVSCSGYDQMQALDLIADNWWNGLDWYNSNGLTILQVLQNMASVLSLSLSANTSSNLLNSSIVFNALPFTSTEMTYRDILNIIAEATGTIARFDRNGALDLRWFDVAEVYGDTVSISADAASTPCLAIDVAEYKVAAIDAVHAKSSENDVGVIVGDGNNELVIINNPLLGGTTYQIETKITPIYNRVSAVEAYSPISVRAVADCSLEAGDIINIVYVGETYSLPIFQQTYSWCGGRVISQMLSNGNTIRPTTNGELRAEYRTKAQMHEFEVTLDTLRSRIESLNGDYSQIEQTVNSISQTIATQDISISNILDTNGEIWTAIKNNATNISGVEDGLNTEINTRQSYIRFIPAEPAIVLGIDEGNQIKLKLVNDKIYFFSGSDDSTDLSNAYAYFNSEETGVDRLVASDSVTVGNWIWKDLGNGHFTLTYVES